MDRISIFAAVLNGRHRRKSPADTRQYRGNVVPFRKPTVMMFRIFDETKHVEKKTEGKDKNNFELWTNISNISGYIWCMFHFQHLSF